MPGYRRFIAYVYEYSQGKKGEGKGFIKVEARNGNCRMNFKLEGAREGDGSKARVYGYVREETRVRGVLLGEGILGRNQAEFELETRESDMGDSGYSLSDLGGLLILGEKGEIYASGWDEQAVRPDLIEIPQSNEEMLLPVSEEESSELEDREIPGDGPGPVTGSLPEKEPAPEIEIVPEKGSETGTGETSGEEFEPGMEAVPEEASASESGIWPEEEPEAGMGTMPEKEPTPGEEVLPDERNRRQDIRIADGPELEGQSAAPLQNEFMPFMDQEILQCRKITPADLRFLGRRDRGLMNNNFLRYGMKTYGHLLLGKRREDGRYILGVPGVYERQESLMANMSGFPYFKDTGKRPRQGKRSGYWYRLIDTPQF